MGVRQTGLTWRRGWLRVRLLAQWARPGRYMVLAVVSVAAVLAVAMAAGASERSFRIAGLVLQLLGTGATVAVLLSTRTHLALPSLRQVAAAWLRRCPWTSRPAYLEPEGITVGCALVGARLTTVFTPAVEATGPERIADLERGLLALQERLGATEEQSDKLRHEWEGKLAAESRARERVRSEMQQALEAASLVSLQLSALGAFWILVGVVLGTPAPEIASVLALK